MEKVKNEMVNSLGSYLRTLRTATGISIREVERRTGISNAYLSQLETGKIDKPSPNYLYKLAQLYDVSYNSLMEKAGYIALEEDGQSKREETGIAFSTLQDLTPEEESQILDFIGYLRSKRRK